MRQCLSHCLLPGHLLGRHKTTQPNNRKSTDLSQTVNLNKAQDTSHRSDYPAFLAMSCRSVSSPGQGPVGMVHTVDLQG